MCCKFTVNAHGDVHSMQASSSESLEGDEPEPCFGDVPPVKERARTMPALAPVESAPPVTDHTHNEVTLRVHSSTSDPNWRKSGT